MFLYLIYRHPWSFTFFFFNDTATTEIYTLSLHDALPIWNGLEPLFELCVELFERGIFVAGLRGVKIESQDILDRKSTRLNSSHTVISYAVFCLKKKTTAIITAEQSSRRVSTCITRSSRMC